MAESATMEPMSGVGRRWEYLVESIHARQLNVLQQELTHRGEQGWELVCMQIPVGNEFECVFKRPVSPT